MSTRSTRGERAVAEAHNVYASSDLAREYLDLLVEHRATVRELALMNAYCARMAQRLVDLAHDGKVAKWR